MKKPDLTNGKEMAKTDKLPALIIGELQRLYMAMLQPWAGMSFQKSSTPDFFSTKEGAFQFFCSLEAMTMIVRFGYDITGFENVSHRQIIPGMLYLVDIRRDILTILNHTPGLISLESKSTGEQEHIEASELYAIVGRDEGRYWIDPRGTESFKLSKLLKERRRIDQECVDFK